MLVFVVVGGQEDDRNLGGLLALLDHVRKLDAGDAGHPDVQNEQCELICEQRQQRLVRRVPLSRGGRLGYPELFRAQ